MESAIGIAFGIFLVLWMVLGIAYFVVILVAIAKDLIFD